MDVLAFDIETAAAEEMHSYGPGFIRLCGWKTVGSSAPVTISTDPAELSAALVAADAITAHNGINFDLMALASQQYISFDVYEGLCARMFDTMLAERQLNPVAAKGMQARGYYGLDATAERYGLAGKSTVDFAGRVEIVRRVQGEAAATKLVKAYELRKRKAGDGFSEPAEVSVLKLLADLYGGFDKIPTYDPDYRSYLAQDVDTQDRVFTELSGRMREEEPGSQRYVRREHYTAMVMGRSVTLEGMRADVDETMRRWSEGQARLEAGKKLLNEKFGMPLEGRYPHRTNAGKAAFRRAILAAGIGEEALEANWPMAKDGSLKTGKDVLDEFIPLFEKTKPAAAELCKVIKAFNGERTVYGTILDHVVGDRVHPYVGPDQSSGRWSMKDPGLTVMGKRGGKARERAIMLADNDDEVLVAIDADQVDARVIAAECQDPAYMALFAPGMDLHSEVAYRVWPSEAAHEASCHTELRDGCCGMKLKCHCERRDQAKVFGHGFSYGLGANGMARQHGVDVQVARGFIDGMTEAFPRLAEWKAEVRAAAGALGYDEPVPANDPYRILHTWAGRPVRVERDRAYTQATALIGQGGTRDVMAEAILKLPAEYRRRVRAVIHDEIVISLPKPGAQEVAQRIADSMAFEIKGVRITFGCSDVARSWAGCYGAQYETAA